MALSWLPKQDSSVWTACAAADEALYSSGWALYDADMIELVGKDRKPDWYFRFLNPVNRAWYMIRQHYRKAGSGKT